MTLVFEAEQPDAVLRRSREVMTAVLDRPAQPWPSVAEWAESLPGWFVSACAPESEEELEAWVAWWRTLDPPGRAAAAAAKRWSLETWLSWLEPEERQWFWWDAAVGGRRGQVLVEVPGWPAPFGALEWLLRAAGAASVIVVEP
ncbi:hypothetical protein [uncultured Friedmanniella sp.]|uniref:hypothetical protein n=1 Tax=uncultured Friedmanniella sp. TaxID=335381 RepID=UPI0035CC4181